MSKLKFSKAVRGENSGKGFFISTFRFDLPLAQDLERISLSEGLSLSQIINQILASYVASVEVPKGLHLFKTAAPTTWGDGTLLSKEEKAKGTKAVQPKKADKPVKAKKATKKTKKADPEKVTDEDLLDHDFGDDAKDETVVLSVKDTPEEVVEALAVDPAPAAASAFSRLKKKSIDDDVPDEA